MPPSMPIHKVSCCTTTADPGIPGQRNWRDTISITGSTVISDRARIENESSKICSGVAGAAFSGGGVVTLTACPRRLSPGCALRYSSRRRFTSSNRSAGTMRASQLRPDGFGELAPFGYRFGIGMHDIQAKLLHQRNGRGFGFADLFPQRDARGARRLHHFLLHGAGILSQTSFEITVAPTSCANWISSMFFAPPNH